MLAACHRNLDLFAVVVIRVVTAVGGGTVGDLVLGVPVFWLQDFTYVTVAVAAIVVASAAWLVPFSPLTVRPRT